MPNNLPPIPEGSPFFEAHDSVGYWFKTDSCGWWLSKCSPLERHVAACVARAYWDDKAQSEYDAIAGDDELADDHECSEHCERHMEAEANTAAWAEWGALPEEGGDDGD